jgi:hypothetical protein
VSQRVASRLTSREARRHVKEDPHDHRVKREMQKAKYEEA